MMRTLLVLLGIALGVAAAWAYVQPAHVSQSTPSSAATTDGAGDLSAIPTVTEPAAAQPAPLETRRRGGDCDRPADPVPEPGTMALASMGLIALGVAVRRRPR